LIRIKRFSTYTLAESFVPGRGQPVYVFDTENMYIGDGTTAVSGLSSLGAGGGVSDHGALTGLADDDHTQYYNSARLTTVLDDYSLDTHTHSEFTSLQSDIDTVSGLLSGKADLSHTHTSSDITDFSNSVESVVSGEYLKLDTSNGPLTGSLVGVEGSAIDPSFQVSNGGMYSGTSPWGTPSLAIAAFGTSVHIEPFGDGASLTASSVASTEDGISYAGFDSSFGNQSIYAIANSGDAYLIANSYAPGGGTYGSFYSESGISQLGIQGATRSWLAMGAGGTTSFVNISNANDQNTGLLFNGGGTFDLVASGLSKLRVSNTTLTTAANILPDTDSTRNIGSNAVRYLNVYADNLHGTISGYSALGHTHLTSDITGLSTTISGVIEDYLTDNGNLYEIEAISSVNNISLLGPEIRTITITGNVTFTFDDIEQGRSITVFVEGDSVDRNVLFESGVRFSGPIPTSLVANKFGVLSLVSLGTTVSGLRAIWAVEE
jgi:hypothetical protein